jgi:alpha-galactosidase
MGWNGYNAFGECATELDEEKLRANIDALVTSGMQSAGYHYVNLDDCWQLPRSEEGLRSFDPERLPGGIERLSNDVHARGLSLGIWVPHQACRQEPGSEGYEATDVETFATWGVDYVKYVGCLTPLGESAVSAMAQALANTGRPIVLSLGDWSFEEWMPETAQLWRTGDNVQPTWSSFVTNIDQTVPLAAYARPGAFNDPDMLEVGNGALTAGEMRAHFSVWSILSAPLLAGNDLSVMTDEARDILTNHRVIALNQDPLGLQAALIRREGSVDVLAKPLAECGPRGVVLWNRSETSADVNVSFEELWLEPGPATVHDLWSDGLLAAGADGFTVTVPGHDAVALRVTGVEQPLPRGRVSLSDLRWTYATNGFGPVELDTTNGEAEALDGGPIRLRGAAYDKGLGVHGPSLIRYRLGGACSRFSTDVGIDDDQAGRGSAQFEVWADGERLFRSGVLTGASPARAVSIDVRDRRELRLFVGVGGDTSATWASGRISASIDVTWYPARPTTCPWRCSSRAVSRVSKKLPRLWKRSGTRAPSGLGRGPDGGRVARFPIAFGKGDCRRLTGAGAPARAVCSEDWATYPARDRNRPRDRRPRPGSTRHHLHQSRHAARSCPLRRLGRSSHEKQGTTHHTPAKLAAAGARHVAGEP